MWCICAYVERSYISYACRVFVCMYVHTVGLHKDNMLIISDMAVCGVFVRMYECRAYACMYACRPSIRAYACVAGTGEECQEQTPEFMYNIVL